MENIKSLDIFYNKKKVGTLAALPNSIVAFQYDEDWVQNSFSIKVKNRKSRKLIFCFFF